MQVAGEDGAIISSNWQKAHDIYAEGFYSDRCTAIKHSVRGFSAMHPAGFNRLFDLYVAYYGTPTYADDFVSSALLGTGAFEGKPDVVRKECVNKGAVLLSVWMQVFHELETAIHDAKIDQDAAKAVEHWDKAWALYAGGLENEDGSGSGHLGRTLQQGRQSLPPRPSPRVSSAPIVSSAESSVGAGSSSLQMRISLEGI